MVIGTLLGGSAIFAVFLVVALFALIFSTYTRRGSGINQRAYGKIYGGAPGAFESSELSHDHSAAERLTR
jgi:hypothetical protein